MIRFTPERHINAIPFVRNSIFFVFTDEACHYADDSLLRYITFNGDTVIPQNIISAVLHINDTVQHIRIRRPLI